MGKVISVANQKGGVEKTTTCVNLGTSLARAGKRVCLIDLDPQGRWTSSGRPFSADRSRAETLTQSLGYRNPDELEYSMADVLKAEMEPCDKMSPGDLGDFDPSDHFGCAEEWEPSENAADEEYDKLSGTLQRSILHHEDGVDLIPGNIELAGIEVSMVNLMSRELFLKVAIEQLRDRYEYILIDCMPSLGMLTINALAAADEVITPVSPAYLPAKGLEQFLLTVSKVRRQINRNLKMEGILLSMVDARTNYAKEIISLIQRTYGRHIWIFQTQIPFSVRAAEASASGSSIFSYDPRGKVTAAYQMLAKEVMDNGR